MSAVPESAAARTEPKIVQISLSQRQADMFFHPAKVLWIGAGTKTGKTVALQFWIADGILRGEPTAWSGSVDQKAKQAYIGIKQIVASSVATAYTGRRFGDEAGDLNLGEAVAIAEARVGLSFNDSTSTIYGPQGNTLFYKFTGENFKPIYGDAYKRFVIDEASRQTRDTYSAALTTTSATKGKIRLAFNLDYGARNWAISELVRVRHLSAEEREKQSVDFMMFPTLAEAWVDPDEVERIRTSGMPRVMFDALYNAVIPEEDAALFKNLDALWSGEAPKMPDMGHTYVMGVDLARKQNWTVATVLDVTASRFVAAMRFTQLDWSTQYERLAELYRYWRISRAFVDQTGIGDPVVEELERRHMNVEGVVFTEPKRRELIEGLIFGCDGRAFTVADTEDLRVHREELKNFEVTLGKDGKLRFSVPEGHHDDAAFSMMLAWYGKRTGGYGTPRVDRVSTRVEREERNQPAF